jgi:hypothetical protein
MKGIRFLVILMAVGALLAVGYSMVISSEVPEAIEIKDPNLGTLKKTPVAFSHLNHNTEYGVACADCHHVYKEGQNVWKEGDPVQKCSECHKLNEAEKDSVIYCNNTYPKGKAPGLKCAYHMNCVGCHKVAKEEGKKAPIGCTQCHPMTQ